MNGRIKVNKKILSQIILTTVTYLIISTFGYYAISHRLNQNIWFNGIFYGISFILLGNWKKISMKMSSILNSVIGKVFVILFFGVSFFIINIPENPMNYISKVCCILGLSSIIISNFINKNMEENF